MKITHFLFLFVLLFAFSCDNSDLETQNQELKQQVSELKSMMSRMRESDDKLMFLASKLDGIKARIVTNVGNIELKFFNEEAPLQCFNFITRAESGFYDNTQFHRVIRGFMIQGGDPNTKTSNKNTFGQGGPIVNIPHEFNQISHKRGILSTARTSDVNAGAGSQFFIMHNDNKGLDRQYTAFGEVTKGMDVVDKIAESETTSSDLPVKPVVVKKIEVYR